MIYKEDFMVKYGILHSHSTYSFMDGAQGVMDLVNRAKELGAPAVALSDHGTLLGIPEFMSACKAAGIKGMPDVEIYLQDDEDEFLTRGHLILHPCDDEGYKSVIKIVTESEANKVKISTSEYPVTMTDVLRKYIKPNENVIATTACVGGYIAQPLLWNINLQEKIDKYKKMLEEGNIPNPSDDYFQRLIVRQTEIQGELEELTAKKNRLKAIGDKKYTMKKKSAKLLQEPERTEALLQIEKDEKESKKAKIEYKKVQKEIKAKEILLKKAKDAIENEEKGHSKWNHINNMISQLTDEMVPEESLLTVAENNLLKLISIFGKNNLFVEIQYHNLSKEEVVFNKLIELANKYELKLVAANDAHMDIASERNVKKRQILMAERFNSWSELGEDSYEYYIKTDEELRDKLLEVYDFDVVEAAFNGIEEMCARSNVKYELSKHYPKAIIPDGYTSSEYLKELALKGIERLFPDGVPDGHMKQLEYELRVIDEMGFSDYLLIVQDYVSYARSLGKKSADGIYIEYFVGPRGSGAGSIVNYSIGITTGIDPIKYGLMFERFLNPARVSMPDIDVDFEPNVRVQMFDYVKKRYGEKATCQISTIGYQLAKGALKNFAKVLASKDATNYGLKKKDKTTLERNYRDIATQIGKIYTELENSELQKDKPRKCSLHLFKEELLDAFKESKKAMEIIIGAELIDGTPKQLGAHAAGCIISDNKDVSDYVPLRRTFDENSGREVWATQCDMVQAERDMGLLKMDFLGLNTLAVESDAMRMIYDRYGKSYDLTNLPFEKEVFDNVFANGNTTGVFQFSSKGMRKMLKEFRPNCFEDIILAVAAYRPGPMDFIPSIIENKMNPGKIHYMIPEMAEILDVTYGYPIYQEQLIMLFNKIAGFDISKADLIRQHMSKKHLEEFEKYRDPFIDGCVKKGALKHEAEIYWENIVDFAKYAFNKSHAAVYSLISYQTAWLKYHYPKELFCAILNNPDNKEDENKALIANDCKKLGIKIVSPDINIAQKGYQVIDDHTIMIGFENLKGIGTSAAEEIIRKRNNHGGFFHSFKDYILNGNVDKKVMDAVIQIGSFDDFVSNRTALMRIYPNLISLRQSMDSLKTRIESLENNENEKDAMALFNAKKKLESVKEEFISTIIPEYLPEESFNMAERSIAGFYVNGSPLDRFPSADYMGAYSIEDIEVGQSVRVLAVVDDIIEKTDKNGNKFAFLTISDNIESVKAICWASTWRKLRNEIEIGGVYIFTGIGDLHEWNDTTEMQMIVNKAAAVNQSNVQIIIHCKDVFFWTETLLPIAMAHKDEDKGYSFMVHDRLTNEYRNGTFRIGSNFMSIQENMPNVRIEKKEL